MDIRHEDGLGAWTVTFRDVRLRTSTELALFRAALERLLQANLREPAYLLLEMSDVALNRELAADYFRVAKSIKNKYTLGMVAYGQRELGQPPDRRAALAALRALQAL
jgi:hypothetical protein